MHRDRSRAAQAATACDRVVRTALLLPPTSTAQKAESPANCRTRKPLLFSSQLALHSSAAQAPGVLVRTALLLLRARALGRRRCALALAVRLCPARPLCLRSAPPRSLRRTHCITIPRQHSRLTVQARVRLPERVPPRKTSTNSVPYHLLSCVLLPTPGSTTRRAPSSGAIDSSPGTLKKHSEPRT